MMRNAPEKIIVPVEYSPRTDHYRLRLPDGGSVPRIELEGIRDYFEGGCDQPEWKDHGVEYWIPTERGHTLKWELDGNSFMDRVEIEIIEHDPSSGIDFKDLRHKKIMVY